MKMGHQRKVKPKQPTPEERAQRERDLRFIETHQVLAQPHRRGDDSDMTDALGMFVRAYQCGRECYEGGNEYFRLVYRWRVANGIPVPLRLQEGESEGTGPLEGETVAQFEERIRHENLERFIKIKKCEEAMKCSGLPGFRAAQNLILDGEFPEGNVVAPVKVAIHSLAIELGKFPW